MKAKREFSYKEFRKKFKLTFKQRHELANLRIIEIFQGGYRGHSLCHPKKIRVLDFKRLNAFVEHLRYPEEIEYEYAYNPPPPVGSNLPLDKFQLFRLNSPIKPSTPHQQRRYDRVNLRKGEFSLPITSPWIINEYLKEVAEKNGRY